MEYKEALAYLRQLTQYGYNFGLERIKELTRRLGSPQDNMSFIHVGGTNGKGSVASMVASILQEAGYRVGLFTSPHLHSYRERMRINGALISPQKLAQLMEHLRPILEDMVQEGFEHPTEFEVNTALALEYFAEEEVDIGVLEVGLGGRIDSTNVIDTSLVTVITNVAMDHMDYLGPTLDSIAREKAGIIKKGGVVVTGAEAPEALDIIEETCRDKGALLYIVGKDVTWEVERADLCGCTFNLRGLTREYKGLRVRLLGRHQVKNAALAVTCVEAALLHRGLAIEEEHVKRGLEKTCWPGRLEIVSSKPMVVIDGAHNYDGACRLREAMDELFPLQPYILVIGMLADKEREKVVAQLVPGAKKVIVTRPNSFRAGDWEKIADFVKAYGREAEIVSEVEGAVARALDQAKDEDLILITGSLYMIADARACFIQDKKDFDEI